MEVRMKMSRMMIRVHHTESLMRLLPNTIFRLIPRHIPLSITQQTIAFCEMILINFFLGTTRIKSLFLPSEREIMSPKLFLALDIYLIHL
jgi:hypothetical protein